MKPLFAVFILMLTMAPLQSAQADCVVKEKLHTISSPHDSEIYGFADAEGHVVVKPQHLMVMDFGDYGYGYADGYWIGLHGERLLKAYPFNGYPDVPSEGEGLMRYLDAGDKLGFVDHCLTIVIPARFDYASRFDGGIALACTGCDINTRDEDPESESWAHKKWGIIDKTGKLIVPMQYTFDQAADQASKMTQPAAKGQTPH